MASEKTARYLEDVKNVIITIIIIASISHGVVLVVLRKGEINSGGLKLGLD